MSLRVLEGHARMMFASQWNATIILVARAASDWEAPCVVGVQSGDMYDLDVQLICFRPLFVCRWRLVVRRDREFHNGRGAGSLPGLGGAHALATLGHVPLESFVGVGAVPRSIVVGKARPRVVVAIFYRTQPRISHREARCCMEEADEGLDAGKVVGAVGCEVGLVGWFERSSLGQLLLVGEEVKVPQSGALRLAPAREDWLAVGVSNGDVLGREEDAVASVADGAHAHERVAKALHDVPLPGEVSGQVGDAMVPRGRGPLTLSIGHVDLYCWRSGVDIVEVDVVVPVVAGAA